MPKADRVSLFAGIKRMFSMKSLVELIKAWGKVLVIASTCAFLFMYFEDELFSISKEEINSAIVHSVSIFLWSVIGLSASTLFIAMVDIPFQIHEHTKKLRMTMQQVKDEHKDTEGKPEVKSRVRQLQMEISQRRMMSNVPDADVIITNPTHFAVALKYDVDMMGAPILLAKGGDKMAFKIREIGAEHNVPILESPALARAVYFNTDVDQEIPEGLFLAIAQVLAYIYQVDRHAKGLGDKPDKMPDFPVPDDLKQE
jgi:flagellar biosynthetic protein FlhB